MIKDKLKEIRERTGMNKKEFSNYIGIKYTTYNGYETGAREPDSDFLVLISKKFDVSTDFILGLQDEKEVAHSYQLKASEYAHIEKYRALDLAGQSHVDTVIDWETERVTQDREAADRINAIEEQAAASCDVNCLMAYYGKNAAAGKFVEFSDIMAGTIQAPLNDINRNADYTIGVSGDSMEPTFYDGDIVYVQKTTQINNGEIGIFRKDGYIYIKEAGDHELISHNSSYKPMKCENEVVCMGRVLGKVDGDYILTE